jgi:hypothetical protein
MHIVCFVLHSRNFGLPTNIVIVVFALVDAAYLLDVLLRLRINELLHEHTHYTNIRAVTHFNSLAL